MLRVEAFRSCLTAFNSIERQYKSAGAAVNLKKLKDDDHVLDPNQKLGYRYAAAKVTKRLD